MCRLYPDDVRFVQPSNGHPDYTMKVIISYYIIIFNSVNLTILNVSIKSTLRFLIFILGYIVKLS